MSDLLNVDAAEKLRQLSEGRNPLLASVTAIETTGFNAIPDAMAHHLASDLNLDVDPGEIRQINKVGHTKAPGFRRFVTPAAFGGIVESGRDYILVDDHVGLGGTLANMKGYIEAKGGYVIAMTTLTETREAHKIKLTDATLNMLRSSYDEDFETFWIENFGHGFDCFTELEGRILCREPSSDVVRGRLAEAAKESSSLGIQPVAIPKAIEQNEEDPASSG